MVRAVVCGAGTAGLAAAVTLRRTGADVSILERGDAVGMSWRGRYDGLKLNTTAFMSSQPGYRARKRRYGEFPSRDSWIRYLEDYAQHHGIAVRFGTQAHTVTRTDHGWRVATDAGDLDAQIVVVATGYDHEPDLPDWPGRASFTGELLHSSQYRSADPFRGRDVLVIGPGTTGSEVANYVAKGGAARVRMACRTPPNVTRRKFLGVSVNVPGVTLNHAPLRAADQISWIAQLAMFGKLDRYGIPRAPQGAATTLKVRHQAPAYDDGFVDELRSGRIEVVAAVTGFDGADVLLGDGTRIQPDAVIAATGYRRGLQPLVGHLGVLDDDGIPLVSGGTQHPSCPGLFFNGFRADLSGQMRLMRIDAKAIARAVRRGVHEFTEVSGAGLGGA